MSRKLSDMTLEELWELFPIILEPYNKLYPLWYEEEESNLKKILGETVLRINHIGSSSVEGLLGKATIDILLEVKQGNSIETTKEVLVKDNWILMSDEKIEDKLIFNKGYTPGGFAEKVYHLHIRYLNDWDELYFRDYLLDHKDVSEEYGQLKIKLAEIYRNDRDGYTEAKTDFIKKYTKKARIELGNNY